MNYLSYVWDCFLHTFKRDIFEIINYLDSQDQDNVFDCILTILDFIIWDIDNDEIEG